MKKKYLLGIILLILFLIFLKEIPILYDKIIHTQKILVKEMKKIIRSEHEGIFYLILGMTFVYGLVHSLGPGHGKSFLSAYILKTKISAWKILSMTAVIAYLQAFLAYIFIHFVIDLTSQTSMLNLYTLDQKTRLISASMIVIIGLIDFVLFFRKKQETPKECWAFSCIIGLCPCPGVMSVLLFINLLGYESYSILFAFSTATGIFCMLSFFALTVKKFKIYFTTGSSEKIHQILHISGSILLVCIGLSQILFLLR